MNAGNASLRTHGFTRITVRRLIEELRNIFLNSIVLGISSIKINSQTQLLGTVVEIRQNQLQAHFSIKKGKSHL
jgi:hypothetical protein